MAASLEPATKVSQELKNLLNDAVARELQVSVQYMWQHVQATGALAVAVSGEFRQTAIAEMKHAEIIAERLWYLGETPTTAPSAVVVGGGLKEFLELDIVEEKKAIDLYRKIIEMARKEMDVTTAHMFEGILQDEEEHHDLFTTMLEEV